MTIPALDDHGNLDGELTLDTYRQLYYFIDQKKDIALEQFQILYGAIAD